MPTYQYACTVCDHRFDAVQSFSDPALTECPACGAKLRKVFSPVGIVFRGSGFYRTDSRAGAGRNAGDPTGNGQKRESEGAQKTVGDKGGTDGSSTKDTSSKKDGSSAGSRAEVGKTKSSVPTTKAS